MNEDVSTASGSSPLPRYDSAVTVKAAELLALGVACILVGAALVYLFGSFFLMAAHVEPRPGQSHARAMMRELYYVLITQPLIPLYFVIGRRMGRGNGIPIVFLHGYFQNRADFWWLARQFRKASKGPLYGFNYPWFDSVDRNTARLDRFVERICADTGSDKVTLIAHSLGGLVSLEYSHSPNGERRVAHCITVGTPHAGVKWRGPIPGKVARELREGGDFTTERRQRAVNTPTLSVYSTHDNIVHPPSTSELSARGGRDVAVDGLGHLSLLYSPRVARVLIEFIDQDERPVPPGP
jgi:pimeloyl-ACP methyl ester carboxylesterase